jgi:hypothetical protein
MRIWIRRLQKGVSDCDSHCPRRSHRKSWRQRSSIWRYALEFCHTSFLKNSHNSKSLESWFSKEVWFWRWGKSGWHSIVLGLQFLNQFDIASIFLRWITGELSFIPYILSKDPEVQPFNLVFSRDSRTRTLHSSTNLRKLFLKPIYSSIYQAMSRSEFFYLNFCLFRLFSQYFLVSF